jgi:hypothetical protein
MRRSYRFVQEAQQYCSFWLPGWLLPEASGMRHTADFQHGCRGDKIFFHSG